ncbi:MAG: hypothetical protein KDD45_16010, partial [Bdellovibrionales bacterium]|nr:hypothetical protein [Bdellovibrionales bacterium]
MPRKQVPKYQNDPYQSKQVRDLGGCEKKVMNRSPEYDGKFGGPGYRIGSSNDPYNDGRDRRDPNNRDRNYDP